MICVKDHKQQHLFDPWDALSPKRRLLLEQDWPGLFQQHLLEVLPVAELASAFRDGFGRPTKELHTVLGVLLLQQAMDLTDRETVTQLSFNIQWHFALNITEESDAAKYISEKTLWSMRQRIIEENLDEILFDNLADKLANVFAVDPKNQRIDSVHIRSNMRRLGRITIFSQTTFKFLVNLRRHHRELFDTIAPELTDRYLGKKALAAFSLVKPTDSEKTLKGVSTDLFNLVEQFKDVPAVCAMKSYKLMQRVLSDHCHIDTDPDGGKKVTVKKPAEVPSDSLQNPSDPDATYSGHKGQGYHVQIMETFCPSEDEKEKAQTLNLITHASVQTACESDAHALVPAIADTKLRGIAPETALADTLYGSDDNHQTAAAAGVKLVAPTQKGAQSRPLSEFTFDEDGHVSACPAGHRPEGCTLNKSGNYSTVFDLKRCETCERLSGCPVKPGKNGAYLRYSKKQQRLAVRRAEEKTEAFIDTYRWRAGVEATMSEYDKLTGVKNLRVRRLKAVRYCAKMKAAGLNLLRAARVQRARAKAQAADRSLKGRMLLIFEVVKERFRRFMANPGPVRGHRIAAGPGDLKLAA